MLDTLTLFGMFAKHSVNGLIVGSVLGAWSIAFLSLKYGTDEFTNLDKICLGGVILAIVLWKVSGNATFGLITSLTMVFLGSIPTFASAWQDPSKEDKLAWTIFWLSCASSMLAIPAFSSNLTLRELPALAVRFTDIQTRRPSCQQQRAPSS